jgi:hypothetical protein
MIKIAASNIAAIVDAILPGDVWEMLTLTALCVHIVAIVVMRANAPNAKEIIRAIAFRMRVASQRRKFERRRKGVLVEEFQYEGGD